jgi:hypothetical protein
MSVLAIDVSSERLSRIAQWLDACDVALRIAAPMVDALVRLSLAKAFFAPGMLPSNPFFEFDPAGWPTIILYQPLMMLTREGYREGGLSDSME